MKLALLVILVLAITGCASTPPSKGAGFAIVQGATSATVTHVAVLHDAATSLILSLADEEGGVPLRPATSTVKRHAGSEWQVLVARFEGLKSGRLYRLDVADATGNIRDTRQLTTLDTEAKRASFAVASCMDETRAEQEGMWRSLLAKKPSAVFLIGDNVYADAQPYTPNVDPDKLWTRHVTVRNTLYLFKAPRLIPVFATWDDHDYGKNDGNKSYPFREQSREIFLAFFPGEPIPGVFERGPGVSSRLTAFHQAFFLMDNRSFRDPEASGSHWGADQEKWLFSSLNRAKTPSWLFNGDQFFGKYHPYESYEGRHPESFRRTLGRLKKVASPVAFVSGDRHLIELMKISRADIGYETRELTSSSIHATVYPEAFKKTPNPRQIVGKDGAVNFAIVESNVENSWSIRVKGYTKGDETLFEEAHIIRR